MVINKIEWRDSVDYRESAGWQFHPDFLVKSVIFERSYSVNGKTVNRFRMNQTNLELFTRPSDLLFQKMKLVGEYTWAYVSVFNSGLVEFGIYEAMKDHFEWWSSNSISIQQLFQEELNGLTFNEESVVIDGHVTTVVLELKEKLAQLAKQSGELNAFEDEVG